MRTVTVTVPAICLDLGPAGNSLGLALALHNTVELRLRSDSGIAVSDSGIGVGAYPLTVDHPAAKGALALFKAAQVDVPAGLDVICHGQIPPGCGLGDAESWIVAGLFAANNVLDTPMHRDKIAALACTLVDSPTAALTAIAGGLVVTGYTADSAGSVPYRRLDLTTALKVLLVVPGVRSFATHGREITRQALTHPDRGRYSGNTALIAEMLRTGEVRDLERVLYDPLRMPARSALIPGCGAALDAARRDGAAVAFSGDGPALLIFTKNRHERIEAAVKAAFAQANLAAQCWVVNVDTQGVAITAHR